MLDIPVNMSVEKVNGVRLVSTHADEMMGQWERHAVKFADFMYEVCPAKFTEELTRRFTALIEGKEEPHDRDVPTQD